ncbi:aminotransferase class I/II-fold pyridoxal phosphate-dependent enzyme [Streptomyces profundus]|nr:aminotransferase class I/II-fold pyridoxal phosphate-dependent enzyme [Streptomyces sp. MA3_2.13]UED88292.1 aminotransferase class I/II-fold pyridoxal phosphate-dependent enzyme [Streptomyces sp. MA3_2.13]
MDLAYWLGRAVAEHQAWTKRFGPHPRHPSQSVDPERLTVAFDELSQRIGGSYPFFHPSYAGQMLKPPHPVAVLGYVATMLVNPNNHALDGGPATSAVEEEVVAQLAAMFGMETHLGHLTGGGTVANLEALFVARQCHPGLGVAYSAASHYTHARMCHLLGVPGYSVAVDARGRMDVDALERLLATGEVGTVVATAGTTGLGAVDPVHEILALARARGVRVHVDAAYGGFFTLLADEGPGGEGPLVDPAPWRAVARCDSVVIDPHKHGLQPYGCGAVLFADPEVRRHYQHDSPYTYYSSDRPHLGEISLECSRSGASAAALWLTLRLLPLTREGLGAVLAGGRRAALRWARLLAAAPGLELFQPPELDIVSYFPRTARRSLSEIDAAGTALMRRGERADDPVFLSVGRVSAAEFTARHPDVVVDRGDAAILRSVLMKPEFESRVDALHARVAALAAEGSGGVGRA